MDVGGPGSRCARLSSTALVHGRKGTQKPRSSFLLQLYIRSPSNVLSPTRKTFDTFVTAQLLYAISIISRNFLLPPFPLDSTFFFCFFFFSFFFFLLSTYTQTCKHAKIVHVVQHWHFKNRLHLHLALNNVTIMLSILITNTIRISLLLLLLLLYIG